MLSYKELFETLWPANASSIFRSMFTNENYIFPHQQAPVFSDTDFSYERDYKESVCRAQTRRRKSFYEQSAKSSDVLTDWFCGRPIDSEKDKFWFELKEAETFSPEQALNFFAENSELLSDEITDSLRAWADRRQNTICSDLYFLIACSDCSSALKVLFALIACRVEAVEEIHYPLLGQEYGSLKSAAEENKLHISRLKEDWLNHWLSRNRSVYASALKTLIAVEHATRQDFLAQKKGLYALKSCRMTRTTFVMLLNLDEIVQERLITPTDKDDFFKAAASCIPAGSADTEMCSNDIYTLFSYIVTVRYGDELCAGKQLLYVTVNPLFQELLTRYFSGFSGTEMRETLETLFQSYRNCTGLHKNIYSPAKYELNVTISYYLNFICYHHYAGAMHAADICSCIKELINTHNYHTSYMNTLFAGKNGSRAAAEDEPPLINGLTDETICDLTRLFYKNLAHTATRVPTLGKNVAVWADQHHKSYLIEQLIIELGCCDENLWSLYIRKAVHLSTLANYLTNTLLNGSANDWSNLLCVLGRIEAYPAEALYRRVSLSNNNLIESRIQIIEQSSLASPAVLHDLSRLKQRIQHTNDYTEAAITPGSAVDAPVHFQTNANADDNTDKSRDYHALPQDDDRKLAVHLLDAIRQYEDTRFLDHNDSQPLKLLVSELIKAQKKHSTLVGRALTLIQKYECAAADPAVDPQAQTVVTMLKDLLMLSPNTLNLPGKNAFKKIIIWINDFILARGIPENFGNLQMQKLNWNLYHHNVPEERKRLCVQTAIQRLAASTPLNQKKTAAYFFSWASKEYTFSKTAALLCEDKNYLSNFTRVVNMTRKYEYIRWCYRPFLSYLMNEDPFCNLPEILQCTLPYAATADSKLNEAFVKRCFQEKNGLPYGYIPVHWQDFSPSVKTAWTTFFNCINKRPDFIKDFVRSILDQVEDTIYTKQLTRNRDHFFHTIFSILRDEPQRTARLSMILLGRILTCISNARLQILQSCCSDPTEESPICPHSSHCPNQFACTDSHRYIGQLEIKDAQMKLHLLPLAMANPYIRPYAYYVTAKIKELTNPAAIKNSIAARTWQTFLDNIHFHTVYNIISSFLSRKEPIAWFDTNYLPVSDSELRIMDHCLCPVQLSELRNTVDKTEMNCGKMSLMRLLRQADGAENYDSYYWMLSVEPQENCYHLIQGTMFFNSWRTVQSAGSIRFPYHNSTFGPKSIIAFCIRDFAAPEPLASEIHCPECNDSPVSGTPADNSITFNCA